ncbi:hypothetical protein C1645_823952 [Glomus cerebriforme]|uniref:Uncharacterized protein n=1 Tax=Glomus cerebriforme TaxID=658196 RepID=A0A397SVI6_9GLOM|nr:hypothetical protein C1645_823952 [Glomus cerebriforme]
MNSFKEIKNEMNLTSKDDLDSVTSNQEYVKEKDKELDENSINKCHNCQSLKEENIKLKENIINLNMVDANSGFNTTLAAVRKKYEEELNSKKDEIKNLKEDNSKLREQVLKYQSKLGSATTFRLNDDDKNNPVQLNEDILRLQDDLAIYVTNLRKSEVDINIKNILNLINKSKVKKNKYTFSLNDPNEITDIPLMKAVLQRHVLKTILDYFPDYCKQKNSGLEAIFYNQALELEKLGETFKKERAGNDIITSALSVKIRQQSFAALGNRGFSNIINQDNDDLHDFIKESKEKLNKEMEFYRKITDLKKKEEVEKKVTVIIREVTRLFYFRLKTQEPIAEWKWLDDDNKFDPAQMIGYKGEEEIEDSPVEMCIFPLIYRESQNNGIEPYTKATVYIHDSYKSFNLNDKPQNPLILFTKSFFKNK